VITSSLVSESSFFSTEERSKIVPDTDRHCVQIMKPNRLEMEAHLKRLQARRANGASAAPPPRLTVRYEYYIDS